MDASIPSFLQTVDEIEQNSWWSEIVGPRLKAITFTYSINGGVESVTEVPREPFESLLLRVRRLTMNDSPENLHVIQKALKQQARHDADKKLLDAWRKYWRLAFIKEPFEVERSGEHEIMTGYKVYEYFINGHFFHRNIAEYNVILYGSEPPVQTARTRLFFENMFHCVVYDLCLAAIALHRFVKNGNSFYEMPLAGIDTAFHFILWRNRVGQLDEQYEIFNRWIETHGGCKKCRWT